MKKNIYGGIISFLFMGVLLVPQAHAETATTSTATATTSVTVMLERIKTLTAQLEELKKQLATVRGEVKATLKDGIPEGTNSEDIKKIQELLATDPTIYPEGKVTGYYGPLTKEALRRFQKRHKLEVTGSVDTDTRDLLEEYLHEGLGDKIPPGLLKAPGVMKKVEDRFKLGCEKGEHRRGMGPLCKRMEMGNSSSTMPLRMEHDSSKDRTRMKHGTSTMRRHEMMDDDDDMEDEDDDEFEIEIDLNDDNTIENFDFTFKGEGRGVTNDYVAGSRKKLTESQAYNELLEAVADLLEVKVEKLDKRLTQAIRHALKEELNKTDDDRGSVVEIELTENGWLKTIEVTTLGSYTGSAPDSVPTRKATQSETWEQVLTEAAGLQLIEVRKLDPRLVLTLKKEFENEWGHYVAEDDEDHGRDPKEHTPTKDTQRSQKTVQAARKVIQAAEIAIKDAGRAITIADSETEHEEEHLDEARTKIKEAHKALEAKDPLRAIMLAKEATDLAEEIMNSL